MGWKFAAVVCFVLASSQGAWAQSVFEDRNGNGVFDGSDVDLTPVLLAEGGSSTYKTSHAVVIAKSMSQRCEGCAIAIESTKRITVNASLTVASKGKGGAIELHADQIVIGSKVILSGMHAVYVFATSQLSIGDTVRVQSLGAGPTYGYGTVTLAGGKVDIGAEFKVDSNDTVDIRALATTLFIGPKAAVVSRHGDVGFFAERDLTIQSATNVKGVTGIAVYSDNGSVNVGTSKMSARNMLIMLIGNSVDGIFTLFSKPYAIYDNAHPSGLYVQ